MWISGALYSEQQLSQWSHPQKLENLQKLNQNSVRGNQLTGNISEVVGDCPNLEYIDLSYKSFHGELSHNWGSLDHLDLSANRLNGSIPANLGDCSNLYYLNLSNNRLSHRIPAQMGKLSHLSQLDLSHYSLSGEIHSKGF
ncbi:LRR receptor-like serine/threonine-protein kinase ERL1 [Vitis vinifera]|uniref:LRR receptor-like serine/threonine-protein kinase ERL1 n=1 Tax=Vitis vinifera TaxID=29760 RepID=UPI002883275C|nr:LRR receptor-like serine/threonine-protein kinase ERL1 [Vitis vinifera]